MTFRIPAVAALMLLLVTCSEPRSPFAAPDALPTADVISSTPEVLVGAGDIAQCDRTGDEETANLLDGIPGTVITIGDNAYPAGTDADYQNCYDVSWGRHKARTRPVPGNHEYDTPGAMGYYNYFGAAAGDPSTGYYSYDVGAWHIIALNNYVPMTAGSAQEQWLLADLAAHQNLCTLAYWHHPLFSSWTDGGTGGIVYNPVKPLFTDLYNAGVDVVLNGHRHWYERFAPQTPDGVLDSARGIREIIAGTGGGGFQIPDNTRPLSEVRQSDTWGVVKLYLYPDSYAWKFVPVAGKTFSDSGSYSCHDAPGGVSGNQSALTAAPSSITTAGQTATITVTARNGAGQPVSGAVVALAATGTGNTLTQPSAVTDANGVTTGTLSSTTAEAKTITATANGIPLTQTTTVTVTSVPSASKSQVAAAPTYIAPGSGTSTIKVTVKDAGGHPIAGALVALSASGSGNTITQPSDPTNAQGIATGMLNSTDVGTKTVSATANGTALSKTVAVIVTTPSASKSTIAANPTSMMAGATSTITVTVKDAGGHAIAGAPVVLSATGSGNTLTQPGLTSTSGKATGTFSSLVPETKIVSATASGVLITKTVTVTVNPSNVSPSLSTVAAAPTTIAAGGTSTITITVKQPNGSPLSNATVVLSATGSGNTITQPAAKTNSSGVTTGTFSSTVAESKTITATANGIALDQAPVITVTTGGVSSDQSTVQAAPATIMVGTGTSTITVTAKDATGNPLSGRTVVLAASGSGNTLTQPAALTDGTGVATGTLSSTVPEAKTVSATIDGTPINQTAVVTVAPGGPSASQSTVVATPTTFAAGGSSAITVTVRDADNNPAPGVTVVLTATGTGKTLTQPSSPTDANGVATGAISAIAVGSKTVSATADGTPITQTATVAVTPGPLSASQSTISPLPASIAPGGETSTIRVTANDGYGNPISGATVVLAASGSGNTLTQPSAPTDATGLATGTLSSSVEETKTVSATIDGTALTQTATVTVVSTTNSEVLVGAGNIAMCDKTNDEATAALLDNIPGTVFTAGDNVVVDGSLSDFTTCYDPSTTWGRHKARTRPAVGDKEYVTGDAGGYGSYFGTAAGPAGSYYYSYDLGDWHIVVLNDNWTFVPTNVGSVQEQWLRADLAASTKQCTLAIFHQPRFTSSNATPRAAAKPFWNDLYAAGAELVVNAHYRNYERFAPQNADGVADPNGIREIVVGTGGRTGFDSFTLVAPNSEVRNSSTFGVLKLTLSTGSYTWEFIPAGTGTFHDSGSGTCH